MRKNKPIHGVPSPLTHPREEGVFKIPFRPTIQKPKLVTRLHRDRSAIREIKEGDRHWRRIWRSQKKTRGRERRSGLNNQNQDFDESQIRIVKNSRHSRAYQPARQSKDGRRHDPESQRNNDEVRQQRRK